MFYNIEGIISDIDVNQIVVECSGIGFLLNVSSYTLSNLKSGTRQKLYISESIGENNFDLYGFYSKVEKKFFDMLISVSGIGPKAAIAILSYNTPDALSSAIMNNDEKALCAAPGIGKKTAQRVILELKDKIDKINPGAVVSDFTPASGSTDRKAVNDAVSALTVLGFSNSEIRSVLSSADVSGMTTEQIIKYVLKYFNN